MALIDFLRANRKAKNLRLFFDIETLMYNKKAGSINPSDYKNVTFSLAVSWWYRDKWGNQKLDLELFSNFYDFFEVFPKAFVKSNGQVYKTTPKIILTAHNANKYDNHFLYTDLLYYYPDIKVRNEYMKAALFSNNLTVKMKELKDDPSDYVFVRMVKAKSSLGLKFILNSIVFETEDSFMKINMSLRKLSEKLNRMGLLDEEYMKTDFNYTAFDKDINMTDFQAHVYAQECFKSLSEQQLTYIRNDVIILAYVYYYYNKMYPDFDYSKSTFSSNILAYYDENPLTHLQLRNKYKKIHIKYTDFNFAGQNFYDYLKSFYFGGLNFYNDRYLGKIIKEDCFNIDLNSSYPNSMYSGRFPAKLLEFKSAKDEFTISPTLDSDFYYLFQVTKFEFDKLLMKIKSKIIRKMFVKYYSRVNQKVVSINSYTLRAISEVGHVRVKEVKVLNYLKFSTAPFGNRKAISSRYYVKSQGKSKKKLNYVDPYHILVTESDNTDVFSLAEIDQAKVTLNGLYGLPALRAYFHLFLINSNEEIDSYPNGYENTERNILFSLFVTSFSFYNFINPLKYFTSTEIDENFLYCDTDSLYFKKRVINRIPSFLLDQYRLGAWKIEHSNIKQFFVLNHKKYCFLNGDNNQIEIRCGGVPKESFNTNMSFSQFVNTQFSKGCQIKNQKSIINKQGTVSIYESVTELDKGAQYALYMDDTLRDLQIEQLIKKVRESDTMDNEDVLYVESNLITLGVNDIYPAKHKKDTKFTIKDYMERNNFCYLQVL